MEWHDPAGKKTLVDLFASALRGETPVLPPDVPAHLQDIEWKFLCECGMTWRGKDQAVVRDGHVAAPRQSCLGCRTWVTGRRLD